MLSQFRIVKLYKYLYQEKKEFILSKQLLRSGTSIGVNIEKAIGGQSDKYFFAKLTIAYKKSKRNSLLNKIAHRYRLSRKRRK